MKILALDVSGNFKEGKGTTGIAYMTDGEVTSLNELKAKVFSSDVVYWSAHRELIEQYRPDHIVIEGYKLYNHAGQEANKQANSELETPQLIGFLKVTCYDLDIPLTIQFASEVKTRWSDKVLQAKGILDTQNKFKGQVTTPHKRDALRHALHFWRYRTKKL